MRYNNSSDQRIFARIRKELPVRILVANNGQEYSAKTLDISAQGIGIESDSKLPLHMPLEIWLELSEKQSPFYTRGEIVWSQDLAEANRQRAGIQLEKAELVGLAPVLWGAKRT